MYNTVWAAGRGAFRESRFGEKRTAELVETSCAFPRCPGLQHARDAGNPKNHFACGAIEFDESDVPVADCGNRDRRQQGVGKQVQSRLLTPGHSTATIRTLCESVPDTGPRQTEPAAKIGTHVKGDPIGSRHRGGMRRRWRVRIPATATSIRSEHDEITDDHEYNRFYSRFSGRTHQHATVHRIVNMSDTTAGRRGQSGVLLRRWLAREFPWHRDRSVVLPRAPEHV